MDSYNEFEIIVDGEKKTAQEVTRLTPRELGITFVYFYLKGDNDNTETEKELYAARVVPDGENYEKIVPIRTEDEKKLAYEIFSDMYSEIRK